MKKNNKQYSENIKKNYENWKNDSLENGGYFVIFKGFKSTQKLKNISGNALKLYIYLGLAANNKTGEVWHSNKTIARYFNKTERTIRTWMQELESLNLIIRFQLKFNEESHTFLQPYYNFLDNTNKYIYRYRLKSLFFRKSINLQSYNNKLSIFVEKNFKNVYVKIKNDYFDLISYSPVNKKELRSINKLLKEQIPELNEFQSEYKYLKSDGSIGVRKQLFERVKLNKNT